MVKITSWAQFCEYARERGRDWRRLAERACARGFAGGDLRGCNSYTPGELRRFLREKERMRSQWRLDLMQAVNRGMASGDGYTELADELTSKINDV